MENHCKPYSFTGTTAVYSGEQLIGKNIIATIDDIDKTSQKHHVYNKMFPYLVLNSSHDQLISKLKR